MNQQSSRRIFLKQAALVSAGMAGLWQCTLPGKPTSEDAGFGKLKPDPDNYLDLPEGFTYKIIARAGTPMTDGFVVPGRPDGMGAFQGTAGKVILVCNHENNPEPFNLGPFGARNELLNKFDPGLLYETGNLEKPGLGGTSTLIYNENSGEVETHYLSLAGTFRNCAGGVTPWGSWLTCEEDVTPVQPGVTKNHGYVFEVPAAEDIQIADPKPITAMGRFNHEAVCVDPATGIVYQTEDRHDGLLYRLIPNEKENLHKGGRLQALVLMDKKRADTRNWEDTTMALNQSFAVEWIDVEDVHAPNDDLRYQGFEKGAARFARGEGMWFGDKELYFACTSGGPDHLGQVFRYIPSTHEGTAKEKKDPGKLILFAESNDQASLESCDNLTIAPWGDIIICEDGDGRNYIRGITPTGKFYNLALNKKSNSELAGVVFSPSGKTLFVNMQVEGHTIAITGPWKEKSFWDILFS